MGNNRNITELLLIYQNSGKYLIDVDRNIELFVRIVQKMWFISGSITFLLNMAIFLLIFKVNRSQRIYHLMQVNCILKALEGIIYCFIDDTACVYCKDNYFNSLHVLIYKSYIVTVVNDTLTVTIGAIESLITLDRLSILHSRLNTNFFKRQDIKSIVPIIILIGIALHASDFFIIDITHIDTGLYYRELNSFSNTGYYNYALIGIRTLNILFLLGIYIKLVISLLISFNRFLERKRRLKRNAKVNENEKDLIKLVLFQSSFNINAAIFATAGQVIGRYEYKVKDENPTDYYMGYLIIIRYATFLIALLCLAISDVAVFIYDSRIRNIYTKKESREQQN